MDLIQAFEKIKTEIDFQKDRCQTVWVPFESPAKERALLVCSITPLVQDAELPPAVLPAPAQLLSMTKGIGIAPFIDHTLLKPEAMPAQIQQLCHEARTFSFATVCVNPCFVPQAVAQLQDSPVKVCTVVGFPLGTSTTAMKMLETHLAIAAGAREIDMVIHIGQLKAGNYDYVRQDIQTVVQAAQPAAIVKVILETCLLTDAEIIHACLLAKAAGAHFVKTSTGFNQAGATTAHIRIIRQTIGNTMGVKAAGGIRDFATAQKMLLAGATRLGTSASVAIVTEASH